MGRALLPRAVHLCAALRCAPPANNHIFLIRNKRLQQRITGGRFTLPVAVLLSVAGWLVNNLFLPAPVCGESTYPLARLVADWDEGTRLASLSDFLLYALMGYLLIELNNRFALIRMRASFQTAVYFLLIAVCPMMHRFCVSDVAALCFLCSLFFLFATYQHPRPAGYMFHSLAFVGLGSLFLPQLTLFVPLYWLGAYSFQSFTFKSFLGGLLGWSLPYWFLFAHAYYHGEMSLFYAPFAELVQFRSPDFSVVSLTDVLTAGYLFVLFAVSAVHCFVAGYEDKIRTRAYLQHLILFTFCLLLYTALQPSFFLQVLPLLVICTSILAGHLLVLTTSRMSNLFFITMLAGWFALLGVNLWMLL